MSYYFRKLKNEELETAYNLHCDLVKHMLKRGINQWLRPIDRSKLVNRQEKEENFALLNQNEEIQVFLSLVKRTDYHEWRKWFADTPTIWLNTVSVNIGNVERGLGRLALKEAFLYLKENGEKELYLDCVIGNGFLVNYYQRLGFKIVGETQATYGSGTFDLVLMKKHI